MGKKESRGEAARARTQYTDTMKRKNIKSKTERNKGDGGSAEIERGEVKEYKKRANV